MKKTISLTLLLINAFVVTVAQNSINELVFGEDGGITFSVEKVTPPDEPLFVMSGRAVAEHWTEEEGKSTDPESVIATSFDRDSLVEMGRNPLFSMITEAYATHRPITLTPDVVWMAISQALSHQIYMHADQYRDRLVDHQGVKQLILNVTEDPFRPGFNWGLLMQRFSDEIAQNTKSDIARTIEADFSTTRNVERTASRVVLMKTVRPYFQYVVSRMICGIPQITLEGSPDDWRKVRQKASCLKQFGMDWWLKDLDPILEQFIETSLGNIDHNFWMDMVVRDRPEDFNLKGGCLGQPPLLDGWFIRLFPFDAVGNRTPDKVRYDYDVLPGMVSVDFKLQESDGLKVIKEQDMELWAGIVGVKQDRKTFNLKPRIGWMVRTATTSADIVQLLQDHTEELVDKKELTLNVVDVPREIMQVEGLQKLSLNFNGDVVVPEWVDSLNIEELRVNGNLTIPVVKDLKRRFPGIELWGGIVDTVYSIRNLYDMYGRWVGDIEIFGKPHGKVLSYEESWDSPVPQELKSAFDDRSLYQQRTVSRIRRVYSFDRQGNETRRDVYHSTFIMNRDFESYEQAVKLFEDSRNDGQIMYVLENSYDHNRLVRQTIEEMQPEDNSIYEMWTGEKPSGQMLSHKLEREFRYDNSSRLSSIRMFKAYDNDTLGTTVIVEQLPQGKGGYMLYWDDCAVDTVMFDKEGRPLMVTTHSERDERYIVKYTYDTKGTATRRYYAIRRDRAGSEFGYQDTEWNSRDFRDFEYDPKGNWIKCTCYSRNSYDSEPRKIAEITRKIQYR